MHRIKLTRNTIVQAAVVGTVFVLVMLAGVSEKTAIGQTYQRVSVNGAQVACVGRKADVEQAFRLARRELAAESSERLCMDYDWEVVSAREPFVPLQTEEQLKDSLREVLRGTVIRERQRVYTVAIDGYRASFTTLAEVQTFLDRVKAPVDAQNEYQTQIRPADSHISGLLRAELKAAPENTPQGEPLSPQEFSGQEASAQVETDTESALRVGAGVTTALYSAATAAPEEGSAGDSPEDESAGTPEAGNVAAPEEGSAGAPESGYRTGILDMEFVETVEVYENYVNEDELSDMEEELVEVTKEKESNKIYVVESGDCLSVIAMDHDTTVSSIVALNQLANADAIREGQELIIAVPEPDLKIRLTLGEVYEEDYTMEPVIRENDSWYTNQEVVRQEGTTGHRERNDVVVYENGLEISREMVAQNVMTESLPAIIEKGTIIPPTYIKPLAGGRYTSGFGRRWGRLHKGVDWACPTGTTVYASSAGTVIQASYNGGYGNNVVISHPDGRLTRYAHNSKLLVRVGQTVKQGEAIALSGNTGRSTGPHVHFEIYINGAAANPLKYIGN